MTFEKLINEYVVNNQSTIRQDDKGRNYLILEDVLIVTWNDKDTEYTVQEISLMGSTHKLKVRITL